MCWPVLRKMIYSAAINRGRELKLKVPRFDGCIHGQGFYAHSFGKSHKVGKGLAAIYISGGHSAATTLGSLLCMCVCYMVTLYYMA